MRCKAGFAGLALGLALPLAALAHGPKDLPDDPKLKEQYRAGYAAYQKENFAVALEKWRPLAEKGSSAAQLFLGFMNANGKGVPRDDKTAAHWYGEAAERGNTLAQVRLAIMYRDGTGVKADRARADYWARMAARNENHMQKIAMSLQRSLEKVMTPAEIAAVEKLLEAQHDEH